ncbi:MAG: glycosyltransferase family 2 protein [Verrucomicrobiae bacterium]|nr:glycosyltransferase family 2 protein [Verrucomicrobiae bacterium]
MISAAIFTLNEEIHLPRCLASLRACDDVVVVDSLSADRTVEIARAAGARVFSHAFTGFGDQRTWAFGAIAFRHPWVLVLDADEWVTPELWEEIRRRTAAASPEVAAFRLKRRFFWEGRPLRRANLYPSWVVRLVRPERVRYLNRGHAETQEVAGRTESLEEDLFDENLKGLAEWRSRQARYAEEEARFEASDRSPLRARDLLSRDPLARRAVLKRLARRFPARGVAWFLYAAVWRGGFLDGRIGLRFCLEKARFQQQIQRRAAELRRARAEARPEVGGRK